MSDQSKFRDQYNRPVPMKFQNKDFYGEKFREIYSMVDIDNIGKYTPIEPYIDKATQEAIQPMYVAGGSYENGIFVSDGTETGLRLVEPEKSGKWEYWSIDTAGGLKNFLTQHEKYQMPNDYNTDELCIIGAGRGMLGFFLGDTGLNSDYAARVNKGLFKNVTMVEEDSELVDWQKYVINKHNITNIQALQGSSLQQPLQSTDDWETLISKKYDMMIATLPFCDRTEGNYFLKQQIRTMQEAAANHIPENNDWPFTRGQRDMYTSIAKFEDKCYDDNFGRHRVLFKNAHKYLNDGGYLITVHHSMASDVDTFKPMIEDGGLELVHHSLIDGGVGAGTNARHFFAKFTMIANVNEATKYVIVCKKK